MGNKRIKRIVLLSIAALFCLFIWRLNSPYKLTQFPYFYGILNSVNKLQVPDSYIYSYSKSEKKEYHKMIECTSATYDKTNNQVNLEFIVNDLNDVNIFSLIVNNISLFMKNHPNSYLNECKIDIVLNACGGSGIIIQNYDEDSSDFISNPHNEFFYCRVTFLINSILSDFKNYTWLEVIEFRDIFEVDDINSLDNLTNLKEIRCPQDMFTDEQKQKLIDRHKGLVFTPRD